jgi:hypothetical protein
MPGFAESHADNAEVVEITPGLVVRRLWRSGPERTARRAQAVDFEPGAAWPGVDEHEPGPGEVFVVSGTFTGLAGPAASMTQGPPAARRRHRPGPLPRAAARPRRGRDS